jgi:hypothetical protein
MLDKLTPSAKIVDGVLVITLPDAIRPVVWQLELGLSKSSAMEVREKDDGTFLLVLKTSRQDVHEIAPYATRDLAVRALMAVSKALEGAQTGLRGANSNNPYHLPAVIPGMASVASQHSSSGVNTGSKTARLLVGGVIILALIYGVTRLGPPAPSDFNATTSTTVNSRAQTGEAISADDYLNAP